MMRDIISIRDYTKRSSNITKDVRSSECNLSTIVLLLFLLLLSIKSNKIYKKIFFLFFFLIAAATVCVLMEGETKGHMKQRHYKEKKV